MTERFRQSNVAGGRPIRREVKLTESEDNALYFAAMEAGMTPARFLKEAALSRQRGITVKERHEVILEVFRIQRSLAAVGNNINQLAKRANAEDQVTSEAAGELTSSLRYLRSVLGEISQTLPRLAVSPEEADPS